MGTSAVNDDQRWASTPLHVVFPLPLHLTQKQHKTMFRAPYRPVSDPSVPKVYFQIVGLKEQGMSSTLKLKLSADSPLTALFAHVHSAVERSRPPSSRCDRQPKPAQFRWHNMVLSPDVDGHRTPLEMGMRTGESHVVSLEVLYPVSSPRRYSQSPINARRNTKLDAENDQNGYHSNLLTEGRGEVVIGNASDIGISVNNSLHHSARRIRNESPLGRYSNGVPKGTRRSESADRVQRTVSDILKDTLGSHPSHRTPQSHPPRPSSQQPAANRRGTNQGFTSPILAPVAQPALPRSSPTRLESFSDVGSATPSEYEGVRAATASSRIDPVPVKSAGAHRYFEEVDGSRATPISQNGAPDKVKEHLASLLKSRTHELREKEDLIGQQQQRLAELERALAQRADGETSSRSFHVESPAQLQRQRDTPSTSALSVTRKRPEDETHYSAMVRQQPPATATQQMDREAKAQALALAIRNQILESRQHTHMSNASTVGSDTQYRHASQWSEATEEDGGLGTTGFEDDRHYSERARSPARRNTAASSVVSTAATPASPDQRTSPLRRPVESPVTSNVPPQVVPPHIAKQLEEQEATIHNQQLALARIEQEMRRLTEQLSQSAPPAHYHKSTEPSSPVLQGDPTTTTRDVSVAHSVQHEEISPRSGMATADANGAHEFLAARKQQLIDEQKHTLQELEARLAVMKSDALDGEQQSAARRSFFTNVASLNAGDPDGNIQHPSQSPARTASNNPKVPSQDQGAVRDVKVHPSAVPTHRSFVTNATPIVAQSAHLQGQQHVTPINRVAAVEEHKYALAPEETSATSSATLQSQDSATAARMRATALENSFLSRKVNLQEQASKEAAARIALLERQLRTQQEKLETTRRQNEVLAAEVDERKRAPRGALDGKTMPGFLPSPYLFHTPARDAAEASERLQDYNEYQRVLRDGAGNVDASFRSVASDRCSVSPISTVYTPDRRQLQPTDHGLAGTPVFSQSLSASRYHGDQLASSRKAAVTPHDNGAPSTSSTPALRTTVA